MIIDGHAYCFPPLGQANGFPSEQEHLCYLQREMADHHQPFWCLEDGGHRDSRQLANLDDPTLDAIKSVGFRSGGYGRFTWTFEGKTYAKQYLPPYLTDLSHSPEMLIAQMDYAGIQRALLHVHPIFGFLNDFVADCVTRFPDRLLGLASIPDWQIEKDPMDAASEIERAYANGLHGYQFILSSRFRKRVTASWDSLACRPFWDAVTKFGKPIFFTIEPPCPGPTFDDYLGQLQIWQGWLARYPDVPAVLTHGFPWRLLLTKDRRGLHLPDVLFEPFRHSSAKMELLFPIALGNIWDYPYTELRPTLLQLVEQIGQDRLIWGSDMPNVERFSNYRQNLATFRVHYKDLLSDDAIDAITGRNVMELFE